MQRAEHTTQMIKYSWNDFFLCSENDYQINTKNVSCGQYDKHHPKMYNFRKPVRKYWRLIYKNERTAIFVSQIIEWKKKEKDAIGHVQVRISE